MKQLLLILTAVIAAIIPSRLSAENFQYTYEGQTITFSILDEDERTCETAAFSNHDVTGILIIPPVAKNGDKEYIVKQIGGFSFQNNPNITSISIPFTITEIGSYAFKDCTGLTAVNIPSSVTTIWGNAFENCTALKSATMGRSLISISGSAFKNCTSLTSIIIPNSVTSIGSHAFENCSSLISATIGDSIEFIFDDTFKDCSQLKSIVFGKKCSARFISDTAFEGCNNILKIAYPINNKKPINSAVGITYNPNDAIFEDGWVYSKDKTSIIFAPISLEGEYVIPDNFMSIESHAFSYCENLTSITLPESLTSIESSTFYRCYGLNSVVIPNSVTSISNYAFGDCTELTSVIIPQSVTSIADYAFSGCSALKRYAHPYNLKCSLGNGIAIKYDPRGVIIEDGWIYDLSKTYIYFAPLSLEGEYHISDDKTFIGQYAFSHCTKLTSLTIPNSVLSTGQFAFSYCTGLKSVVIPDSFKSIARSAFIHCSGLESVIIPGSVTSIEEGAFSNCSALKSIIIPDAVTSIGGYTFSNCSELASIDIPNSITSIDSYTFNGCSKLASIIIPGSIRTIGNSSFANCTGLTSVIIPQSVIRIGSDSFAGCSSLKKSAYPDRLSNPFDNGVAVEYDPDGVIIEDGWIYGPDKKEIRFAPYTLEGEFTIPDTTTGIGNAAFEGCSKLTSIVCTRATPPIMHDNSFSGLYDRVDLYVPEGALTRYVSTNWSLFKYMHGPGQNVYYLPYSDGFLNYRLITSYNSEEKNQAIVIPGNYSGKISVPERFTYTSESGDNIRYYVTAIGYKAFADTDINEVSFNSRIDLRSISDYAFYNCRNLKSINIPSTVENIGSKAFADCRAINAIDIPSSVKHLGAEAFAGCSALTSIHLNDGLESIGDEAFKMPDMKALGSELYMPSTIKEIGKDAFSNIKFSSVDISDISSWCGINFSNEYSNPLCTTGKISVNGKDVSVLTIPGDVTEVNDFSFINCANISEVALPYGLERIGQKSFYDCKINSISIPATVSEIGSNALGAQDITFEDGTAPIIFAGKSFYRTVTSLSWGRPIDCIDYNTFDLSYLNNLTIGNLIDSIPAQKFWYNLKLKTLKLGSGITEIGENAFTSCNLLTEVVIPPAVTKIGSSAFSDNSKLTSIIMGHSVNTIGEKAFDGCPASSVCITTPTPPTASNNTFSSYSGKLWLQGESAIKAYYDAFYRWDRFDSYAMDEAAGITISGEKLSEGKPGDKIRLSATLMPENITLPQVFWRSTNPEIATVDMNGVVTLHTDFTAISTMNDDSAATCKIIAESLYANGPIAEFNVADAFSDVDDIVPDSDRYDIDYSLPIEVYNINGIRLGSTIENLSSGIYILRQGDIVRKISVK